MEKSNYQELQTIDDFQLANQEKAIERELARITDDTSREILLTALDSLSKDRYELNWHLLEIVRKAQF